MKFFTILITIFVAVTAIGQSVPLFPGDNARFLSDITYPDGSTTKASSRITKTWEVRNSGLVDWKDRELRIDGDAQGFELAKAYPFSATAGSNVRVSVDLIIPQKTGHYIIHFKQYAKVGKEWRQALPNKKGVYIDVNVD